MPSTARGSGSIITRNATPPFECRPYSVISLLSVSIVCWDARCACSISSGDDTLTLGHPDMKRGIVLILPLTLTSTLNPSSPHLSNLYLLSQPCSKHGQIEKVSLSDAILVGCCNAFSFFQKCILQKERAGFLCVQDNPLSAALNAGSLGRSRSF